MTDVPEDLVAAAGAAVTRALLERDGCFLTGGLLCALRVEFARALLAEREKFQICGYQRRLKWQTPEAEWFSCSTREATDPFESVPSFEYRAIYTAIRSPAHD